MTELKGYDTNEQMWKNADTEITVRGCFQILAHDNYNGILCGHKKKKNLTFCNSVGRPFH